MTNPTNPADGDVVTHDSAAEALDSLDDFGRMDCGVDATGPRETLERYIAQQRAKEAQQSSDQGSGEARTVTRAEWVNTSPDFIKALEAYGSHCAKNGLSFGNSYAIACGVYQGDVADAFNGKLTEGSHTMTMPTGSDQGNGEVDENEKMREFEKFFVQRARSSDWSEYLITSALAKSDPCNYAHPTTNELYYFWNGSRAALTAKVKP